METRAKITCDVDSLLLVWWDREKAQCVPIESDEDVKVASAAVGCPEELLDILVMLTDSIKQAVSSDLRHIWQRLDKAGV